MKLDAREIHARIGRSWPDVLVQLGIGEHFLRNRHGACPACGGKDRFRFDNRHSRGDFICNQCGAGDGFKLLQLTHGWPFKEARRRVIEVAKLEGDSGPVVPIVPAVQVEEPQLARPSSRVLRIRRECCSVEALDDAIDYLDSRGLWPLPHGHALKAHASLEYWDAGRSVGRYPALVAEVRDGAGELVTLHVTYLERGRKLAAFEPRKILSPLTGRHGCAVRLMPLGGDSLGIAEGIETALSAARLHELPAWAALNTSLLTRFDPPPQIRQLVLFADRDIAGLEAASRLMERLQGRVTLQLKSPPSPHKDWNEALQAETREVAA